MQKIVQAEVILLMLCVQAATLVLGQGVSTMEFPNCQETFISPPFPLSIHSAFHNVSLI